MADLAIRLLVERLVVLSLNEITTDHLILSDNEGEDEDVCARFVLDRHRALYKVPSGTICVARCEYMRKSRTLPRRRFGQSAGSFHQFKGLHGLTCWMNDLRIYHIVDACRGIIVATLTDGRELHIALIYVTTPHLQVP
jgi:hypothetical protein